MQLKQLHFIPVFVYTYIKVKLKKGKKEMTAPKQNHTCRLLLLAAKTIRNLNSKAKQDSPLIKPQKQPQNP